jgi:predicted transcriptional regulator YdeE
MTNGFKFIGISIRTTNENNQAYYDLESLWKDFFSRNITVLVPNKASNEIVTIYTDYQNDYKGFYTAIIGFVVSTLDNLPEGLIGREFEAENFIKITAQGEIPMSVADAWREIWKKDKKLNRRYTYDFEVYGENSQKGINSEVDIYIASNS